MRVLALIAVAACSSPDPGPSPLSFIPPLPKPVPRKPVPPPPPPPLIPPQLGSHGAPISRLAVAEDGSAAVTADDVGGIRLWPALDGSREPVVVRAPAAGAIAVSHERDELGVAILDQAGALTVIRFDRDGHLLGRGQIGDDIDQVIGTPRGFLAVRTDETIDLVSRKATRLAHFDPERRIAAVVYRNDRALVLGATSKSHVAGRWLELAAAPHWGDTTAELAIAPNLADLAALAPDHAHLVVSRTVVDLATGKQTAIGEGVATGFIDATTVLVRTETGVVLRDLTGKRIGRERDPELDASAAADGMFVFAHGGSLALATATDTHYLGYQDTGAAYAKISALGTVLHTRSYFLVDAQLAVGEKVAPNVIDALPIGGHHTATLSERDETDLTYDLFIDRKLVLDDVRGSQLQFDPKTHLLAVATSGTTTFFEVGDKIGPKRVLKSTDSPLAMYFVDTTDAVDQIYLTDPDLANGRVAYVVHGTTVREITTLAAHIQPAKTYDASAIATIDRAGRIYTHVAGRDIALRGSIVTFPNTAAADSVAPSPDTKLVAIASSKTIALFTPDGQLRWRIPSRGLYVEWDASGQLLAVGLPGIATFDLATGELAQRRCGWGFGLTTKPVELATTTPAVCDL